MAHSRRTFLKNSALAAAATGALPLTAWTSRTFGAPTKRDTVGLQLYSVRDAMGKDPSGSLKKLADMGYKYVEHAGYKDRKFYGYGAKEFKTMLAGMGLKMCSGHTRFGTEHWDAAKNDFTDEWKRLVDDAATAGQ